MADQTREAIDARYAVTESLKGLIYGPHWGHLTKEVQDSLTAALSAVEESEDITAETTCIRCGRSMPVNVLTQKPDGYVCAPLSPEYDACMRIYNAV